ncbi:Hpt domain-containing protein [Paracoccus sp. p4-l81]|uniref:Hpt domain-containing protein n=1 Tax=unclassified Paracoccus (in: a-proteobacteria) TaxID=2688777 RepID=UPI0035BA9AE3
MLPPNPSNPSPLTDELQQRLANIRQGFLTRLVGSVDQVDRAIAALRSGGDPAPVLDGIRAHLHRLAGTASTMGFERLGSLAATVEQLILDDPRQVTPDLAAALHDFLTEADEVMHRHDL